MPGPAERFGSYDNVAAEYYDAVAHPTCRNFRAASAKYLAGVAHLLNVRGRILEVGAGLSLAANMLLNRCAGLDELVLLDRAPAMLQHSWHFSARGAKLIAGDATALPFYGASFDLVAASLGAPTICRSSGKR